MKPGDLYKQAVKAKLNLKGYYVSDVEKFQRNEIFNESDFAKFTQFEHGDYIICTGYNLKFKPMWNDLGHNIDSDEIIKLPIFIHLKTFKLFIFRINFVVGNYFVKIADIDGTEYIEPNLSILNNEY